MNFTQLATDVCTDDAMSWPAATVLIAFAVAIAVVGWAFFRALRG